MGARRVELRTSSLSVPYENRNFLPIKHLQNAPNALFSAKRTDSVHDTVQGRRSLSSHLTPVIARRFPSISAGLDKGNRIRPSTRLLFCASIVGHSVAKTAAEDVCPNSSSRPNFRSVPLRPAVFGVRRLICVFSASSPAAPYHLPIVLRALVVCCFRLDHLPFSK